MVYCTKCGAKNPDDAKVCSQCGSPLKAVGDREYYRRMEDECFGIPHGGAIVGVAIGAIILIWGVILILQELKIVPSAVDWWPIALMVIGVLFIIAAIYRLQRRRR
jgi:uncharacterized membrane protein YvbJ